MRTFGIAPKTKKPTMGAKEMTIVKFQRCRTEMVRILVSGNVVWEGTLKEWSYSVSHAQVG